jgi:hypothetical protein
MDATPALAEPLAVTQFFEVVQRLAAKFDSRVKYFAG